MTEITYILLCLITSLEILAIYMIWGKMLERQRAFVATMFDKWFGLKMSKYIQAPLWDCYICMSSVWTIVLMIGSIHNPLHLFEYALTVCGISTIINYAFLIDHE